MFSIFIFSFYLEKKTDVFFLFLFVYNLCFCKNCQLSFC